jgi:hypothetical protein
MAGDIEENIEKLCNDLGWQLWDSKIININKSFNILNVRIAKKSETCFNRFRWFAVKREDTYVL